MRMEATHDYRLLGLEVVEDAVWKPAKKGPAKWSVDDRRDLRKPLYLLDDGLEAREEVSAEIAGALRVPSKSLRNVRFSFRSEANPHSRPSNRVRTSSQGDAASGSSR